MTKLPLCLTRIYRRNAGDYAILLENCEKSDVMSYVAYPAFELFLLLHVEDGYAKWIAPHKEDILKHRKEGKRRYLDRLFSKATGMTPKSNSYIGDLTNEYSRACRQERLLNQDASLAVGRLTSNIGLLIGHLLES